jgi:hypothetical protein
LPSLDNKSGFLCFTTGKSKILGRLWSAKNGINEAVGTTFWAQDCKLITLTLLLLIACSPFNRLQELNHKSRILATGVAVMGEGEYQAFKAFDNLDKLSNYRLESRTTHRDQAGKVSNFKVISEHDSHGNIYTVTQTPDGRQHEIYVVEEHTYVYETAYDGWIDLGTIAPDEAQQTDGGFPAGLGPVVNPVQVVAQLGAVPTVAGHEFIYSRAATRYDLEYVTAELTETFGNRQSNDTFDLQGRLWVDDQTGALLRSEILFYRSEARQPSQEYFLEVSRIGSVEAIELPAPVVNPAAVVSATATAQAWSVLQAKVNYQGRPVDFELVPLQISPATDSTQPGAAMRLILRRLPADIGTDTETHAFLAQVEPQLKLGIPQQNLVVASGGFQMDQLDLEEGSVDVVYFFDVDLAGLAHVELILSGPGNPIVAAIPVVDN